QSRDTSPHTPSPHGMSLPVMTSPDPARAGGGQEMPMLSDIRFALPDRQGKNVSRYAQENADLIHLMLPAQRVERAALSAFLQPQPALLDTLADRRQRDPRHQLLIHQSPPIFRRDGEGQLEVLPIAESVQKRRAAVVQGPGVVAHGDLLRPQHGAAAA